MNETILQITALVARACGLLVLLLGLWVVLKTFAAVQDIYQDPGIVDSWAVEIERRSNLDRTIEPVRRGMLGVSEGRNGEQQDLGKGLRLSYFVAWIIVLLLLLLLARIGLMAVKTGGELLLYDTQIKTLAREIVRTSRER